MDIMSLPPEQLTLITETASKAAHTILQKYADEMEVATNWRTLVSFRLADNDLFHIQRTGCDVAIIFVNGYEMLTITSDKSDRARMGKFRIAAVKAIKLAATLSKNGSALITGDLAYAITKERKRLRRQVISMGYNALDDRYFSLSGTITLTDKLGGRTITAEILPIFPIESQILSLKHSLSLMMLQDSETEEMIDLLETNRNYKVERDKAEQVDSPTSYTISADPESNAISTHVNYHKEEEEKE